VDKLVHISEEPLDIQAISRLVRSDRAGAIDMFIGTVRDSTQGKKVVRLEFESYDGMAIKEIQKIIDQAKVKWPVEKMSIYHRKGILNVGEIAVVIAVSTPHRKASFEACEFAIDMLKETVPIWKKEVFEDGEVWVAAHP